MIHTEPEYVEISPDMERRLREFRAAREAAGDPVTTSVGSQILYEDDDVRVWEMRLRPGEHSQLHRHEHDYLLAIDSGDLVAGVMPSGSEHGDWFVARIPPRGNTVRIPAGAVEWAFNVGDETYHEVLVELKRL